MLLRRHVPTEFLSRMADGLLEAGEQSQLRLHLDACPDCLRQMRAMDKARSALRGLPVLEGNPLEDLQPPTFVPVSRAAFPWLGFSGGLALGAALLFLVMGVGEMAHSQMRLVSAPTDAVTGLLPAGQYLRPGETLNTLAPGDVDLEIRHHLRLRLKPGTTVTWQELNRPWFLGGRPHVVLNVMRGQVLARTEERFWGARLQVRTPTANAVVKGTAFSVNVEPERNATQLKVLVGEVFFTPYLGNMGTYVRGGQVSEIQGRRLPKLPGALSPDERRELLETYRIGEDPAMALVMGGGPERVKEMLEPGLLFVSMQPHPDLHLFTRRMISEINNSILQGELASHEKAVRTLEIAVRDVKDPLISVPLRMYLGACNLRLGYPLRARSHFSWVVDRQAQHPLAPAALGALGVTAEEDLHNPELAQAAYQRLLSSYPRSPEASLARQFFQRYRKPQ